MRCHGKYGGFSAGEPLAPGRRAVPREPLRVARGDEVRRVAVHAGEEGAGEARLLRERARAQSLARSRRRATASSRREGSVAAGGAGAGGTAPAS